MHDGPGPSPLSIGCAAIQCCLVIPIVILAGITTAPLSGLSYYVLDENEGFEPQCRAILYDMSANGVKIDWGTYGGGTIMEFSVDTPEILFERVHDSIDANITMEQLNEARVLSSKDCAAAIIDEKYIVDLRTGDQVPLHGSCGGQRPGVWHPGAESGVWVTPLILGAVLWGLGRCLLLVTSLVLKNELDAGLETWIYSAGVWLAKIIINFWLSPVTTMQLAKTCPHVVTANYSGISITWLNWLFISLLFGVPCFAGILYKQHLICKSLDDETKMTIGVVIGGLLVFAWVVPVLVYKVNEMVLIKWSLLFSLNIRFELTWPELKLDSEIFAFEVLTFILTLLDVIDFLSKGVNSFRSRRSGAAAEA